MPFVQSFSRRGLAPGVTAVTRRARPLPRLHCRAASGSLPLATGAGDGAPPPKDGNGGGGGGNGDGTGGNSSDIGAMLAAAGRGVDSLPSDMQTAYKAGTLAASAVKRYLELEANWLTRTFLPFQGFRERLMADPSFFVKVGIECGIGIGTKCAAECEKRKGRFTKELDFVTANVIMAIIADFMLVWLPAPTMSFATAHSCRTPRNAIARFFSCCPDNAFQKVPEGFPRWTVAQRAAAPVRNGAKLLGVGFCASMLGVVITNCLIWVRKQFSEQQVEGNSQNPFTVSAAYATYMATSSNLRYQILAGVIEERGIETLFAGKPAICGALSTVLRTANTFLGSLMWVDFIRLVGLQPKNEEAPAASDKSKKK